VFAPCEFRFDVFYDYFAVTFVVEQGFEVADFLLFGFGFFAVLRSFALPFEKRREFDVD
jgi:hypothetical protein